jgi:hypothetical protein
VDQILAAPEAEPLDPALEREIERIVQAAKRELVD